MEQGILRSQILAALQMLRFVIESCSDEEWSRTSERSPFWAVAYHTVFFAHLYLSPSEDAFEPFDRAVEGKDGFGRTHLGDWSALKRTDAYAKADVLAYCDYVGKRAAALIASTSLDVPSGFPWLRFSRGEAHLYNLRHIQHHVGQLAARLRRDAGRGTPWIHAFPEVDLKEAESGRHRIARGSRGEAEGAADVTLRRVTNETFRECIGLSVGEPQKAYIASNVFSLAEAEADGVSQPRAVYAGEEMVGFIMYDFDPEEARGYITRLMIAEGRQRKGYGRAAMRQVIALFVANPDCREIYTSIHPENDAAKKLYLSLGFHLTGEIHDGEAVLRMPIDRVGATET